jgi:hypothetical protein
LPATNAGIDRTRSQPIPRRRALSPGVPSGSARAAAATRLAGSPLLDSEPRLLPWPELPAASYQAPSSEPPSEPSSTTDIHPVHADFSGGLASAASTGATESEPAEVLDARWTSLPPGLADDHETDLALSLAAEFIHREHQRALRREHEEWR